MYNTISAALQISRAEGWSTVVVRDMPLTVFVTNGLVYLTYLPQTILRPFFRDYPGEPVPEENFWTLWCKGRLTDANTPNIRCHSIRTNQCSHPPSFVYFYSTDALPAAQTTASKHWRQPKLPITLQIFAKLSWKQTKTNIKKLLLFNDKSPNS